MQRGRDEFLAGSRLASDEHRQVQRRHPRNRLVDLDDGRVAADDHGLGSVFDRFRVAGGSGESGMNPAHKEVQFERFRQIVEDAVAAGKSRGLHASASGDKNGTCVVPPVLDGVDEVETGSITEVDVGDHKVEILLPEDGDAFACRSRTFDPIALLGEGQRHHLAHGVVVVNHEDPCFFKSSLRRQTDPECASLTHLTLNFNATAVPCYNLVCAMRRNAGSNPARTTLDLPLPLGPTTARNRAIQASSSGAGDLFRRRVQPRQQPLDQARPSEKVLGIRGIESA